ncbi:MAG TPA: sigma-54 dependent transcriptional regulator [Polyangia bacterium]
MASARVLVIDDNLAMAETIVEYLTKRGLAAEAVSSGEEGIRRLKVGPYDAVLTDLRMKGVDGMDVLEASRASDSSIPVVIMTAFGAVDSAIEAIQRGAYHYLTKPFKLDVLGTLMERALKEKGLQAENELLRQTVRQVVPHDRIVGQSDAIRQLVNMTVRLSSAPSPVLILGETGTGKELVARALHASGRRSGGPYVAINCAAVPENLLESELFGHTRGAFTGAAQARRGLFVEADSGTLLLDEIGDMPLALQPKLLRVLETSEVRPVGGDASRTTDVRIVASTHRDLAKLVREGKFREDLYFRIRVVPLRVPPLRERREDIPLLVDHFLARSRERFPSAVVRSFSPAAMRALIEYPWPGNVRQLEHTVERWVVTGAAPEVAGDEVKTALAEDESRHPLDIAERELWTLDQLERRYIQWVLDRVGGNKTRASEILQIDPSTIYRRGRRGPEGGGP